MAKLKLNKVQIENYMKLTHVSVDINGKDLIIKGKNETGKSTFINTMWVALTGKDIPNEPIQNGKDSAEIRVEVKREDGTIIVAKRRFNADGKNVLTVSTLDGKTKYSSPQTFLNALIGEISFDPFELMNMKPAEQKKYLQKVLKIDTTQLEETKKTQLAEKKSLEEKLIADQSKLDEIPMIAPNIVHRDPAEAIEKERTIQKQQEEKKRLNKVVDDRTVEIDKKLEQALACENRVTENKTKISNLEKEIYALNEQNESLGKDALGFHMEAISLNEMRQFEITAVDEYVVDDRSEVEALLTQIKENNDLFDKKEEKDALEKVMVETRDKIDVVKKSLKEIESDRIKLISSIEMPISGLDFSEDGITFEGLPFTKDQFSTARMNMIGFQIAVALNPKLRILRVKDWLLFDKDTQTELTKFANANEYQMFMEMVSDDKEIGFEIISGGVI